ncbi:glycosyltransferase family 2 protein [Aurantivibrio plasticivorans]
MLSQSYSDIEYIIIDGCSIDDTRVIIDSYGSTISICVSEPDSGIYDAMNKGVAMATGDIVAILNSDDLYESDDVVATMVDRFIENPATDIVFGDVVFCKSQNIDHNTRLYGAKHFRSWKLRFGWMPPHPGTFIRKRAYDVVGPYSLDFKISADYDMFIRLLYVNKLNYLWVDKVLVRMRQGGVSTSGLRNSLLLNQEIVAACKRNGLYTNLLLVLSKIPFKLLEFLKVRINRV